MATAIPKLVLECKVCKKALALELVTVRGFHYHPECFQCGGCKKQIFPNSAFMQAEDPSTGLQANWHKDCYKRFCAPRCCICNDPIEGRYAILDGKNYHMGCVPGQAAVARPTPASDQEGSAPGGSLDRSMSAPPAPPGQPAAASHLSRDQSTPAPPRSAFGELCGACRLPLQGEHVIVQGKGYHNNCFVCAGCNKPVERGVPFIRAEDGYGREGPWHKECYASKNKCFVCQQPIEGKYLNMEGKKLHNWCLLCAGCNQVVDPSEFIAAPDRAGEMKQWHEQCYMEGAAPLCGACEKPIGYRDRYMLIGGKKMHNECFACLGCRGAIGTGAYYEDYDRDGRKGPWHVECHAKRHELYSVPVPPVVTRIVAVTAQESPPAGSKGAGGSPHA